MYSTAAIVTVSLFLTGPIGSADDELLSTKPIPAVISAIDDVLVAAEQSGKLVALPAREGDEVQQGALIAQIDDQEAKLRRDVAEFERQLAEERAKDDVRYRAAVLSAKVEEKAYELALDINKRQPDTLANIEIERRKLSMEHGYLQTEVAAREQKEAKINEQSSLSQLSLAEQNIAMRKIEAPQDGVVAELFRRQGEWVQQGQPIARLVRMDRLRIEAFVPTDHLAPHEWIGRRADVIVYLSGRKSVELPDCKVNYVNSELEHNGEVRIRLEVDNRRVQDRLGDKRWLFQPGMSADIRFAPISTEDSPGAAELKLP